MKKHVILAFATLISLISLAADAEFVNLGLKSGTLWKNANESGYYKYSEATAKFGKSLPSKKQLDELISDCKWTWNGSEYKITGPNGNYITLPAEGYKYCNGKEHNDTTGAYWSRAAASEKNSWFMFFNATTKYVEYNRKCEGLSVRVVE